MSTWTAFLFAAAGEFEKVSILIAIAVREDGYREVPGAAEGVEADKAGRMEFFKWLQNLGLDGVGLIVGDRCPGMPEAEGEVCPDAKYQRCAVHFHRNALSAAPRSRVELAVRIAQSNLCAGEQSGSTGQGERRG